jgi:hypothetical protein
METPWGQSQTVTKLGQDGIVSVSKAGHGGIYVPGPLLRMIPVEQQGYAAAWSGSVNWYEEDCAWCYVALAFPGLFTAKEIEAARETAEWIARNTALKGAQ